MAIGFKNTTPSRFWEQVQKGLEAAKRNPQPLDIEYVRRAEALMVYEQIGRRYKPKHIN